LSPVWQIAKTGWISDPKRTCQKVSLAQPIPYDAFT